MSLPANARSETRMPASTPMEMASRKAFSAWGGPMVMAVTLPPSFAFRRRLSSMAYISKGLMIEDTPSLIKKLQDNEIQCGVATGKMYVGEVARIIAELNLSPLHIVSGGGMIINWKTGDTPLHRPISAQSTQFIVEYLKKTGYVFSLETKDNAYMLQVVDSPAYTKDMDVKQFAMNAIPQNVLKMLIHASANKLDEKTVMIHIKNIQKGENSLWVINIRCWTLDFRRWTVESRLWTLDVRLWTEDDGQQALDYKRETLDYGLKNRSVKWINF